MGYSLYLFSWFERATVGLERPLRIAELGDQDFHFPLEGDHSVANFYRHHGHSVLSIDISGRGSSVPWDLDKPIPEDHVGKYNFVTNAGSIEHMNGQYQAWKNVHDLCEVGGVMAHALPEVGHWGEHGRYYYPRNFVTEMATACGYDLASFEVHQCYDPGSNLLLAAFVKNKQGPFIDEVEFKKLPIQDTEDVRFTGDYFAKH